MNFSEGDRVLTIGDTVPMHLRGETGTVIEINPGTFRPVMVELDEVVDPGLHPNPPNHVFAFKHQELKIQDE